MTDIMICEKMMEVSGLVAVLPDFKQYSKNYQLQSDTPTVAKKQNPTLKQTFLPPVIFFFIFISNVSQSHVKQGKCTSGKCSGKISAAQTTSKIN